MAGLRTIKMNQCTLLTDTLSTLSNITCIFPTCILPADPQSSERGRRSRMGGSPNPWALPLASLLLLSGPDLCAKEKWIILFSSVWVLLRRAAKSHGFWKIKTSLDTVVDLSGPTASSVSVGGFGIWWLSAQPWGGIISGVLLKINSFN